MTLYCRSELIRLVALTNRQPDNTGQSLLLTVTTATLMVHAEPHPSTLAPQTPIFTRTPDSTQRMSRTA